MARVYKVVCLNCGEVCEWCKYDPPIEKCGFCGCRLSFKDNWTENVEVFGAWSGFSEAREVSETARTNFFKRRGYRFRLPDGVWCTIKMGKEYPKVWFCFNTYGVHLLFRKTNLADAVELLKKKGLVPREDLFAVVYRGKYYPPHHPAAEAVIKAVEANMNPELFAVIDL